ncbi:hypothetical protein GCM10010140_21350 [Streptosporangium pseudovulgare]|uniref:Uncharacterized protein n=1 Tax=Streptosporangium pseudovulgare TaxID=35765 RepID=A0ABQ2QQK0_9ACTN|nr:hypothetical protein GCM10010140_21350 [Streptosporangium pseudovulgare]
MVAADAAFDGDAVTAVRAAAADRESVRAAARRTDMTMGTPFCGAEGGRNRAPPKGPRSKVEARRVPPHRPIGTPAPPTFVRGAPGVPCGDGHARAGMRLALDYPSG